MHMTDTSNFDEVFQPERDELFRTGATNCVTSRSGRPHKERLLTFGSGHYCYCFHPILIVPKHTLQAKNKTISHAG